MKQTLRPMGRIRLGAATLMVLGSIAAISGGVSGVASANSLHSHTSTKTKECQAASSKTWTKSLVIQHTGVRGVDPVFNVPQKLTSCTLAFLNPGLSYPYFEQLSQGMEGAARLYHVKFIQTNLNFNYGEAAQQFATVEPERPAVVGVQTSNDALWNATKSAHIPLVTVDSTQAGDPYHMGVNNAVVGKEAATLLAPAIKKKLAGAWAGKTLMYVALDASGCPACSTRVQVELSALEADGISFANTIDNTTYVGNSATVTASQEYFADVLTANPNDVFVVASFGDEPVVGSLQAANAAGRIGDVLAVSLGGDNVAIQALRDATYDGSYLGAVDFNPYSEGWNWVATAIAVAEHKPYKAYEAQKILTAASVG